MGIKQLSKLLRKVAAPTLGDWHFADDYRGSTVAIDASPCLYQCLTAMADAPGREDGVDVSHVLGALKRTVRLLELGVRPIFVFDGEAPAMKKKGELSRRERLRARSRELLVEAEAVGDAAAARRHATRLVKVTQRHNDEVAELLSLMGVPHLQAPSEAECVCAALATSGRADFVATEDLDALVFGAPRVLRHLHQATASPGSKGVQEINLEAVLGALKYSHPEFVDLCILCGCDYLGTIQQVGIHRAHLLMTKHRSIEEILKQLDPVKHTVPDGWDYQAARDWFRSPDVGDWNSLRLQLGSPDVAGLRELLLTRHGLHDFVVEEYLRRLVLASGGAVSPPLPLFPGCGPETPEKPPRGDAAAPGTHMALTPPSSSPAPAAARGLSPASGGGQRGWIKGGAAGFAARGRVGATVASGSAGAAARGARRRPGRIGPALGAANHFGASAGASASTAAAAELARTGQSTLAGCFARAAATRKRPHSPSPAPAPTAPAAAAAPVADAGAGGDRKRRRIAAIDALVACLGPGIDFPEDAPVEELERLVAQLEGASTGGCSGGGGGEPAATNSMCTAPATEVFVID